MMSRLSQILDRMMPPSAKGGLRFDRPLLLLQSDDWGRMGVRDREGFDELRAAGIDLGESPYDFYSLETAEDLAALSDALKKHRDSAGRNPSMVMNFIMANVDFNRALSAGEDEIPLVPLNHGLPGKWRRPGLLEAYRQGIEDGVFFPALHGVTHFCAKGVTRELDTCGERRDLLRKMWAAETPYIYRRMTWIGYEYWDPELEPERRFLSRDEQRSAIDRAAEIFRRCFQAAPFSACAPGYRANHDTRASWFEAGIRVSQNGPGGRKEPFLDERGMLHTFRTVEMEPRTAPMDLRKLVDNVEACFHRGLPAVVSIHSINFHSTIRNFRGPTLSLLDEFLTVLKKRWPEMLFVNDADLFRIATEGSYFADGAKIEVGVAA
jgi:hypothetical protein